MTRQPTEWKKIFANKVTKKEVNLQNLQTAHATLYQKNPQKLDQKMERRSKQTFLHWRHTDDQEAHEEAFSIANYQRNANQSYSQVPPHTSENGHHQKVYRQ